MTVGLISLGSDAPGEPPARRPTSERRTPAPPEPPVMILDLGPSGRIPYFGYVMGIKQADKRFLEVLENGSPVGDLF